MSNNPTITMNAYQNCILEETNSPTCFKVPKRFDHCDRHIYASHLRRTGKHTWKHSLNDNTCRTRESALKALLTLHRITRPNNFNYNFLTRFATLRLMKLNLSTTAEDARRLGIILIAAGLVAGFLEGGHVFSAAALTGIGLVLSWYGNLEQP